MRVFSNRKSFRTSSSFVAHYSSLIVVVVVVFATSITTGKRWFSSSSSTNSYFYASAQQFNYAVPPHSITSDSGTSELSFTEIEHHKGGIINRELERRTMRMAPHYNRQLQRRMRRRGGNMRMNVFARNCRIERSGGMGMMGGSSSRRRELKMMGGGMMMGSSSSDSRRCMRMMRMMMMMNNMRRPTARPSADVTPTVFTRIDYFFPSCISQPDAIQTAQVIGATDTFFEDDFSVLYTSNPLHIGTATTLLNTTYAPLGDCTRFTAWYCVTPAFVGSDELIPTPDEVQRIINTMSGTDYVSNYLSPLPSGNPFSSTSSAVFFATDAPDDFVEKPTNPPTPSFTISTEPSSTPTVSPTSVPSKTPSEGPSTTPSLSPSNTPSLAPSDPPTLSSEPSQAPTIP